MEVILVNDGSPDRCGQICDEYARVDSRVQTIHKNNGGIGDARNAGIKIARGEHFAFIDSDDWIHEEYIKKLYELLIKTNADIAVCSFLRTKTEDVQVEAVNNSREEIHTYSNIEALEELFGKHRTNMVMPWGKLYKRYLFDEILFPVGRAHEDLFVSYKLIHRAKKIVLSKAQLIFYRQRKDSFTGVGFRIRHSLDLLDAFEEMAEFFRDVGLRELEGRAYKTLFFTYIKTIGRIDDPDHNALIKELLERARRVRNKLRRSKQGVRFKVFYEMYFASPAIMYLAYQVCVRLFYYSKRAKLKARKLW